MLYCNQHSDIMSTILPHNRLVVDAAAAGYSVGSDANIDVNIGLV